MIKAQDILAFDYASARAYDADGHLHVKQTNISRACVSPYYGREVPNGKELGLSPDRIYNLLRDPVELAAAADSFSGKPLLFGHVPISADSHDHMATVGSISGVKWDPPYLKADLSCWSGPAIRAIEDRTHKELSSSYHYKARMTPGTYEGTAYDGVMTGIMGNHCALVERGRCGSDVAVRDGALAPDPVQRIADAYAFSTRRSPAEIAALTGYDVTKARGAA